MRGGAKLFLGRQSLMCRLFWAPIFFTCHWLAQCASPVLFVCVAASVCFPLQRTPFLPALPLFLRGRCSTFVSPSLFSLSLLSRRAACVWVPHSQYHGCLRRSSELLFGALVGAVGFPCLLLARRALRGLGPLAVLLDSGRKSGCTYLCIWPVTHPYYLAILCHSVSP